MKSGKFYIITIVIIAMSLLLCTGILPAEEEDEVQPITLMGSAPRLEKAVLMGDAITIKEILEKEPEKINSRNSEGKTPLHLAVETPRTRIKIVEYLLHMGAEVNARDKSGATPLLITLKKVNHDLSMILIKSGADVTIADNNGVTPLHLAETMTMAKILVRKGAEINALDRDGHTPIYLWEKSYFEGFSDRARAMGMYLLSKGAILTYKEPSGLTILHKAAFKGHTKVADWIIRYKAVDVNARNNEGWTPLHCAAHNGHSETALFLIRNGADVNAKDRGGFTPLYYAQKRGHSYTSELLKNHGGKI